MKLIKEGYSKDNIISYGNMFLLANGRFGYRGTLEEYRKNQLVNFTALGFYDKYQDLWREPINLPNPFYFHVDGGSILEDDIVDHKVELDIKNAVFARFSTFKTVKIESKRFVSSFNKDLLVEEYKVISLCDQTLNISFGLDTDISEINGPHYITKRVKKINNSIVFNGTTNERKLVSLVSTYRCNVPTEFSSENNLHLFKINKGMKKGDEIVVQVFSFVTKFIHTDKLHIFNFERELERHKESFNKLQNDFSISIYGDDEANFEVQYSLYQLLILIDENSVMSIPARGLSGQTYKGAVFWDTEMFILPFLIFSNPKMARNTLVYRINTLGGAKSKAKELGYKGAFYAWESQDDGKERCSKYNVTDPITNEPIRTYFGEKQIHISGDVVLAIDRYVSSTCDTTLLDEGGYQVIDEVVKFYKSFAKKLDDGKYHFLDVIGPDEYHEGINDNAYTNYLIHRVVTIAIKYNDFSNKIKKPVSLEELIEFKNNIYRPSPNENGIIEQFDGYFKLEDVSPEDVKKRTKNPKEYLGGTTGVATPTRVIKQADVIAMLVFLRPSSKIQYLDRNYKFYLPYTEHGSSLSSSAYSIAAALCDDIDAAYSLFRKSSSIDLGGEQKNYAGGVYIGGTHPASNAGAILSLMCGLMGMRVIDEEISFEPHLPDHFEKVEATFLFRGIKYHITVNKEGYKLQGE